jgi:DNA-directed RNA polymerase specialized sigma24 family protein
MSAEVSVHTPSPAARALIAQRVFDRRALLVARIRRRLATHGVTTIDADDIFSTTLRRIDALALAGRMLDTISDDHLLALASAVATNAAHERTRSRRRDTMLLRRAAYERTPTTAVEAPDDLALLESSELDRTRSRALLTALNEADLEILGLRLRGIDWPVIAAELRMTPAAVHRRYFRALRSLSSLQQAAENLNANHAAASDFAGSDTQSDAQSPASLP